MVSLDWRVDSRDGVALVELTVTNPTDAARRVRVANRLDGPVWPPRREGVPEAGWDDGGFEGVVAPGGRRALGYASPIPAADFPGTDSGTDASVADSPAEIVWTERAGETERADAAAESAAAASVGLSAVESGAVSEVEPTPEGVVRALGDARPPADAVPRPDVGDDSESSSARRSP